MTVFRVSSIAAGTWNRAVIAPKICAATSRQKNGMATISQLWPILGRQAARGGKPAEPMRHRVAGLQGSRYEDPEYQGVRDKLSGGHGFLGRLDRDQDPQDGAETDHGENDVRQQREASSRLGIRHACEAGFWFIRPQDDPECEKVKPPRKDAG